MNSVKRVFAFAKRNIKEIIREPLGVIFLLLVPVVMLVLFYFLFSSLTAQFEIKYLAPAMVGFGLSFITLFSGLLVSTDKSTAFLTRLYTSPLRPFEFILGYALALLPIAVLQAVLFFLVAVIIDVSFLSVNVIFAILLSVIVSLLFIALGLLFGSVCNEKSIGGLCSIVIMGQSILSGMWFPLEGLSEGFLTFMEALPFRNVSILLQNVCMGSGDILIPLLIILGYTVVAWVIAVIFFSKNMKK